MTLRVDRLLVGSLMLLSGINIAHAEDASEVRGRMKEEKQYERDNTGVNVRDRNEGAVTADQQSMGGNETEMIANIRRALTKDDSLSTYGKNVKIITEEGGTIVLRGPVRSQEERNKIARTAQQHAPKAKIVNNLEVEPDQD
jgi:hyperosmotically inducible periplasmic protein